MKTKKTFRDIAGFDDTLLIAIGYPAASILVSLLLFDDFYEQGDWSALSVCFPMSFVYTGVYWYGLRLIYIRLKIKYPSYKEIRKRLTLLGPFILLLYLVVNWSLDTLFHLLLPGHKDNGVLIEFITTIVMTALVIATYEAASTYVELQKASAEKAELERHYAQSQLEGLRNQVNPHFLFNSLNTLTWLIPESPEKAVSFVQKLSKVYRYVLESRDTPIIPLQEELDYLHAYVFLLKERFGDNLQVEIGDLSDKGDAAIVPLTLQMLFENVIKHNVISAEKPLAIQVFAENDRLVVRNRLQKKNQVMDSTGVGLDNIRMRYKLLAEREVDVIVSNDYFTVLLPMLALKEHFAKDWPK